MTVDAARFAKPIFFDQAIFGDRLTSPGADCSGAGHRSALIDDPDLCPPWPPLPHPHLVSTDMLGALQGVAWPPPLVSSDMLGALQGMKA
jgi:hypothetical protein